MKIEKVAKTLLNVPAITALVSDRVYPVIIPKSVGSPANYVVFQVISNVPRPTIDAFSSYNAYSARLQVTAAAATYAELKSIVQAIRNALHLQRGTIAGVNVTSVVLAVEGPEDFDGTENVFVQPVDFLVTYRE